MIAFADLPTQFRGLPLPGFRIAGKVRQLPTRSFKRDTFVQIVDQRTSPDDLRWCVNCDLPLEKIDRLWICPKPSCSPRDL